MVCKAFIPLIIDKEQLALFLLKLEFSNYMQVIWTATHTHIRNFYDLLESLFLYYKDIKAVMLERQRAMLR